MAPLRLFISHAYSDKELYHHVAKVLAPEFDIIEIGSPDYQKDLEFEFSEILENTDGYLLLLTASAINSENVLAEADLMVKHTSAKDKILIPLLIGDIKMPERLDLTKYAKVVDLSSPSATALDIRKKARAFIINHQKQKLMENDTILGELYREVNSRLSDPEFKANDLSTVGAMREFLKHVGNETDLLGDLALRQMYKRVEKEMSLLEQRHTLNNYYLVKINPGSWPIPDMKVGFKCRFATHDQQNVKRVEFELFMQLNPGDLLLGFAFGNYMSLVCEFRVTGGVAADPTHGEGVAMEVIRLIRPEVPFAVFRKLLPFADKLGAGYTERLFKLDEQIYRQLLGAQIRGRRPPLSGDVSVSFNGDLNFRDTPDQLDVKNDVDAFASIIALRSVTPPLAIGLFGEWGAGKSFFIDQLNAQIRKLSERPGEKYLKHIVQVEFNAWHYSDSNLWASMITHIFEKLNDYAQDTKFDEDSVKELYAKLNLASIEITAAADEVELAAAETRKLEKAKADLEADLQLKKDRLDSMGVHDMLSVVMAEPVFQAGLKKVSDSDPMKEVMKDINDIDSRYQSLSSDWGRLKEAYGLLTDSRGGWWKVAGVAVFLSLCIFLFFFAPFQDYLNLAVAYVLSITGTVLGFLKGLDWLKPYLRDLRKTFSRVKSLKENIRARADKLKYTEQADIARLEQEIALLKQQESEFEAKLEQKKSEKARLTEQIDDIGTGKLITSFISGKSADRGYQDELGIISRIRKDFTQLDRLFRQQKGVDQEQYKNGERFQIDRIVLYIDDLDSCSTANVVKTLEAIHLLLAFELFVVVVGVDSRWLDTALTETYSKYFADSDAVLAPGSKEKISVTSFDYLEKIFQIPFALKPMNDTGKRKLIYALTEKDLDQVEGEEESVDGQEGEEADILADAGTSVGVLDSGAVNGLNASGQVAGSSEEPEGIEEEDEEEEDLRVTLTSEEVGVMQDMAYIFGHTPRAVTRFVNIYRVIRAHKSYSAAAVHTKLDFMPTMLILGIVLGYPVEARRFIVYLDGVEDMPLQDFIDHLEFPAIKSVLKVLPDDVIHSLGTDMLKENLGLVSRFSFRTYMGSC